MMQTLSIPSLSADVERYVHASSHNPTLVYLYITQSKQKAHHEINDCRLFIWNQSHGKIHVFQYTICIPIREAVCSGMGEDTEERVVIWYWKRVLAKECLYCMLEDHPQSNHWQTWLHVVEDYCKIGDMWESCGKLTRRCIREAPIRGRLFRSSGLRVPL